MNEKKIAANKLFEFTFSLASILINRIIFSPFLCVCTVLCLCVCANSLFPTSKKKKNKKC